MKRLILLFLFFSIIISGNSQAWKNKRIELWGGVCVFQYFGDIGGSADESSWFGLKDIRLKSSRPGFNIGVGYRLTDRVYAYGSSSFGFFAATDKGAVNSARNFTFHSVANEFSIQGVYYLIRENQNYYYSIMKMRGGLKKVNQPVSVFIFTGFGGVFSKPFAEDNLIDNPQFSDKSTFALTFPFGVGAKLNFTPELSFGVDLGARFVLSDQLEGLTTQFSKHNDLYYVLNFKAIYRLSKGKGIKQIFRK